MLLLSKSGGKGRVYKLKERGMLFILLSPYDKNEKVKNEREKEYIIERACINKVIKRDRVVR